MVKWEYWVMYIDNEYHETPHADLFNYRGLEGWELVAVIQLHRGSRLYFKRPIVEKGEGER